MSGVCIILFDLEEMTVNAEMCTSLGSRITTSSSYSSFFSSSSPNSFSVLQPQVCEWLLLYSMSEWSQLSHGLMNHFLRVRKALSQSGQSAAMQRRLSLRLQPKLEVVNQSGRREGGAQNEATHLISRACRSWWLLSRGAAASARSTGGVHCFFCLSQIWAPGRSSMATPGSPAQPPPVCF